MENGTPEEDLWEQVTLEDQPDGQVCNRCGKWKLASEFKKTHGKLLQPCKEDWGKGLPPLPVTCLNPECKKVFTPKRNGWTRFCSERCSCTVRRRGKGQLPREERFRPTYVDAGEKRFRPTYVDAGEKRCSRCGETKPLDAFSPVPDSKVGARTAWCRRCQSDKQSKQKRDRRHAEGRMLGLPVGAVRPAGPYLRERRPGHPRAKKNGWVLQHILVAEEKYGFPVPRGMTVHHKNDDKTDNRPENLELRVGNHGYHGDIVPTLLARPEERALSIAVLAAHPTYRAELIAWLRDAGHITDNQSTEGIQPAA